MKKVGCLIALVILLLVGVSPLAATPISDFPAPFVQGGTIYATNGTPTMAIIIGSKAATWDMLGAAMIAAKMGSHLYYSNASWVDVEDAAAHGITLYHGGFSADEYYIHKTELELLNGTTSIHMGWTPAPFIGPQNGIEEGCGSNPFTYANRLDHTHPFNNITGEIFFLGGTECGLDYDYVLMPLEDIETNPAQFDYIVGINASIYEVKQVVTVGSPPRYYFYLNTGLIALSKGADISIPWLGFRLHVDDVKFTDTNGTPTSWDNYRALIRMINNEGVTVAYMNISYSNVVGAGDFSPAFNGAAYETAFVFDGVDHNVGANYVLKVTGDDHIHVGDHEGIPVFIILLGTASGPDPKNWIPLPEFNVILANITSDYFPQTAATDEIAVHYGFHPGGRFNTTDYPVSGWGLYYDPSLPVNAYLVGKRLLFYTGQSANRSYMWSSDVFPWFNGNVIAYDYWRDLAFPQEQMYVFNGTYGIQTWHFNETKHIACDDFLFTSIGNFTKTSGDGCPLTAGINETERSCTFICGCFAGLYKISESEDVLHKLECKYLWNVSNNDFLAPNANSYGGIGMAYSQVKSTVYARGVTGVFAGIFDRFEDKSGKWTGTTVLTFNSSGGVVWAEDHTPAEYKDQVYSGEDVFSFVKMPIIYLDSWVFVNNTLTSAVKDKNLILIGGPAVNSVVKYLNDAGLLPVKFVFNGSVAALSYEGKTYDLDTVLQILVNEGILPAPISKEYVYRVEGGNGLGVIEYATKNPFGSGQILVVAGTDRYGTLAASVALADPTKLASSTASVFYNAGRNGNVNAVILLGIMPTTMPSGAKVTPTLTPVIVAIPPSAAGS